MKLNTIMRTMLGALVALSAIFGQQSNPAVVISQVYGGGGNSGAPLTNDYVELFNRSGAAVNLSGFSVQYTSATGTGLFGAVTTLSGTIPVGGYYLVQMSGGTNGISLPTPDATGTASMAAGSGKVVLASTTSGLGCNGGSTPCSAAQQAQIIDLVGYGAANFFEGTGAAPQLSNTTAAFRAGGGCTDTNDNSANFTSGAPAPRNSATTLNPCAGGSTNPTISGAANPSTVAPGGNTTISGTLTPGTGPASVSLAVACNLTPIGGGAATAATVNGTAYTLATAVAAATTAGSKTIVCTVTDNTNRTGTVDVALAVTGVVSSCGSPATLIGSIQGTGAFSPLSGSTVTIEGVVTGDFQTTSGLNGFFVQDAGDGDEASSDGVFISEANGPAGAVTAGQRVRIDGTVAEVFSQTVIRNITAQSVCSSGNSVQPVDVTLPVSSSTFLERYEGMLIRFPQQLFVTDNFNLGRFNEVGLSVGNRLFNPTQVTLPGASALALQTLNDRSRIVLDDGSNRTYASLLPAETYPLDGGGLSAANSLRLGDRVNVNAEGVYTPLTGVLGFDFSVFRVHPTTAVNFSPSDNPRPLTPPAISGRVKVAFGNVLNYFTTFTNVNPNARGADNETEFARQRAKIINAFLAMDPAVLGISELENNANAIADLVNGLNASNPGKFAFINTGTVGTDAIRNAIIYQPALVQPIGTFAVFDSSVDPRALTLRNRPTIAQTFRLLSGSKPLAQHFTFVVKHLKSKGSACASTSPSDPDINDGQDNCNLSRVSHARAVLDWLLSNPTGDPTPAGDRRVLIVGDLNSYLMEDPIKALTDPTFSKPPSAVFPGGLAASTRANFVNLADRLIGANNYSYLFQGQSGTLDYALANPPLFRSVSSVAEWHINADEPTVFDYNSDFGGNGNAAASIQKSASQLAAYVTPDPFRTADHDPILIGFNPLCGDVDDDGDVDAADAAAIRNAIGRSPVNRRYDFDLDGQITLNDFRLFAACAAQAR
ncbi:MAG: ExeM/NucH family extracellular endonuclease [Bryobacteraceae bacterium]|nr:ExeM/NucH family extracellular endonuclease [Bryobacteraceae bacterium]